MTEPEVTIEATPEVLNVDVPPLFADEALDDAELTEPAETETEAPEADVSPPEPKADDALQRQVDELKAENFQLRHMPLPEMKDPFEGFKPLSDEEFENLREEDPDEAIAYLRKETRFKEYQQKKQAENAFHRDFEDRILNEAWSQIEEVIPNALDRTPEAEAAISELHEFATENGFKSHDLAVLTNPSTRIIVKGKDGRDRVMMLGDTAAAVVRFIDKYNKSTNGRRPARAASRKPSQSNRNSSDNLSEDDWAKLPESERRALLGG